MSDGGEERSDVGNGDIRVEGFDLDRGDDDDDAGEGVDDGLTLELGLRNRHTTQVPERAIHREMHKFLR